ncbi:MAG: deoxyribodipyrimidine photo-lyase [Bdellovibrionota bacterium]
MSKPYAIHWFRRDLRVAGNPVLSHLWKTYEGRVLGLFCFDHSFLSRDDFSVNRFAFFLDSLKHLRSELREAGGDLLVMDIGPAHAFEKLFDQILQQENHLPECVGWCTDYEPFARKRDEGMKDFLESRGVSFFSHRDHVLIEPHELCKPGTDQGYQVYSPFAKRWIDLFQTPEIQTRIQQAKRGVDYLRSVEKKKTTSLFAMKWNDVLPATNFREDLLEEYIACNKKKVTVEIPATGSQAVLERLEHFSKHIDDYADERDIPSHPGTSMFSMYLKNGSLTLALIVAFYELRAYKKKNESGRAMFLSELIWREFYYHILYRHPHVEHESFLEKYRGLRWENDEKKFSAWKEGKTGFPIVDAGMRELKTTGWMHNRVRMIVASFLTKDLLIDWRWGEKYFMEQLLDGDLAPNNGGWQWAASTGCDPQPYFRIFNPWSQSKKFDPDGTYIKTFVPELSKISSDKLHDPQSMAANYIPQIVDHSSQREKALKLYKQG